MREQDHGDLRGEYVRRNHVSRSSPLEADSPEAAASPSPLRCGGGGLCTSATKIDLLRCEIHVIVRIIAKGHLVGRGTHA